MKDYKFYFDKITLTNTIFGRVCELIAKDWLIENGWRIIPFSDILELKDITYEIKSPYKELLTEKQQKLITQNPFYDLTDFVATDTKRVMFIEVKGTNKTHSKFTFATNTQRNFVEEAQKVGFPLMFILINIVESKINQIRSVTASDISFVGKNKFSVKKLS